MDRLQELLVKEQISNFVWHASCGVDFGPLSLGILQPFVCDGDNVIFLYWVDGGIVDPDPL